MSLKIKLELEKLITDRECWITRREAYAARIAEGYTVDSSRYQEIEGHLNSIHISIERLSVNIDSLQ